MFEFGMFVGWIGGSILVATFANNRGREGIGWFFVSIITSPLIAGVILAVLPNIAEEKKTLQVTQETQKKENEERIKNTLKISGADFMLSMDALYQLYTKKILSNIEFEARKLKLIDGLQNKILTDSPEKFLGEIVLLLENKILSEDELKKIKDIVFNDSRNNAFANNDSLKVARDVIPANSYLIKCPSCGKEEEILKKNSKDSTKYDNFDVTYSKYHAEYSLVCRSCNNKFKTNSLFQVLN